MSTHSIWLETFASTPRTIQAATNDPDPSSDALQHNVQSSASPPSHPDNNNNPSQSSQAADRTSTPRLHGAGESAGSQRESPMSSPSNLLDSRVTSSSSSLRVFLHEHHPLCVVDFHVLHQHYSFTPLPLVSTVWLAHRMHLTQAMFSLSLAHSLTSSQPRRRLAPTSGGGNIRTATGKA